MDYRAWIRSSNVETSTGLDDAQGIRLWEVVLTSDPLFGYAEEATLSLLPFKLYFTSIANELAGLDARMEKSTHTWRLRLPAQMARVVSNKVMLHTGLQMLYEPRNATKISQFLDSFSRLESDVHLLWRLHTTMVLRTYHPVPSIRRIDVFYGRQLARIRTSKWRLQEFMEGKLDELEELSAPRRVSRIGIGLWACGGTAPASGCGNGRGEGGGFGP